MDNAGTAIPPQERTVSFYHHRSIQHTPHPTVLAACLATALALSAPTLMATTVSNCLDSGPGSLRNVIGSASDMDTVDLSQLGGCTITLTTGALSTSLNNLTLTAGNGAINAVTIDGGFNGGHHNRVLTHTGDGTLTLEGVVITDAKYNSGPAFQGGCILSEGAVRLIASTVSHCTLFDTTNSGNTQAIGGGIWAQGGVYLLGSTVSDNVAQVLGTTGTHVASGGGIYAAGVTSVYSTIANNTAAGANTQSAHGGAIFTQGNIAISYSTIAGNHAQIAGGIYVHGNGVCCTATISNSTISGNISSDNFIGAGGVYARGSTLVLSNSTIAFNTTNASSGGGVYAHTAQLQSSIIADNTAASAPSDLTASAAATGANNLVFQSDVGVPGDTLVAVCPQLLPLADNGGGIQTHALLQTSRAINAGNNALGFTYDERGQVYPRVVGGLADIGAFERNGGTDDRVFGGNFELGCDE